MRVLQVVCTDANGLFSIVTIPCAGLVALILLQRSCPGVRGASRRKNKMKSSSRCAINQSIVDLCICLDRD